MEGKWISSELFSCVCELPEWHLAARRRGSVKQKNNRTRVIFMQMENSIFAVQILSEPQVRLEGGVFANKLIGGEKKFRGPTDEAGASGQSFNGMNGRY